MQAEQTCIATVSKLMTGDIGIIFNANQKINYGVKENVSGGVQQEHLRKMLPKSSLKRANGDVRKDRRTRRPWWRRHACSRQLLHSKEPCVVARPKLHRAPSQRYPHRRQHGALINPRAAIVNRIPSSAAMRRRRLRISDRLCTIKGVVEPRRLLFTVVVCSKAECKHSSLP